MKHIIATKSEFLDWGFSLDDCPEFSEIPLTGILLYYDDGYWYFEHDGNDPLSDPDEGSTPETWLSHVSVPKNRIKTF